MKRKLEDLNLLDNFLFGQMVTYPNTGKEFTKILLRIIFGREFDRLTVIAQKVYYGNDTDLHGVRLDLYIEDEENAENGFLSEQATVYDIEPDKNDKVKDIKNLPRRVRFYHAKIDERSLQSGTDYGKLKNVVVIMIMPYDPFGLDRMVYTVKNRCVEEPDMEYDDGASTLFLYTKGTRGETSEALRQLLNYMEHSTQENAVNEDLETLHNMVTAVKRDSEVTVSYMRMMEDENILLARGREEGKAEGKAEGAMLNIIELICRKLRKSKTPEMIAEELEEDFEKVNTICKVAEKCAPGYDVDEIYGLLSVDKEEV